MILFLVAFKIELFYNTIWGSIAALENGVEECASGQLQLPQKISEQIRVNETGLRSHVDIIAKRIQSEFRDALDKLVESVEGLTANHHIIDQNIMAVARGSVKIKNDLLALNQSLFLEH
jgi:hypothetical protein